MEYVYAAVRMLASVASLSHTFRYTNIILKSSMIHGNPNNNKKKERMEKKMKRNACYSVEWQRIIHTSDWNLDLYIYIYKAKQSTT